MTTTSPDIAAPDTDDPDTVIGWERTAIGLLLLSRRADELIGALHPDDFSTVPHQYIHTALLANTDGTVDQMQVLRDLIEVRQVVSVLEPAGYLSSCQTKASLAVGDFSWYAARIKEAAEFRIARRTIEQAQQALKSRNMDTLRRVFEEGASRGGVGSSGVRLTSASSFAMKGTKWLSKGRIPAGMISLIAGREGIGKSTVSLDIAARLTRGTLDGRYLGQPQNVILCATEDSWEHTIVPRLKAVNADLDRVFHIAVQDESGGFRPITAPGDVRAIEKAIVRLSPTPALLVIDPFISIIDGRIDTHVQQQVQQGLEPLADLCQRATMAAVGLIHVNKSTTTDALNSVMGSKAFTTIPRSVLFCIADPSDDETYLFTHEKCNVGPKVTSLTYRLSSVRLELDPAELDDGDEPFITTSRVTWVGEDDRRAGDVLVEMNVDKTNGQLRKELREFIDKKTGVVSSADIVAEFEDVGATRDNIDQTLRRMVKKGEITKPMRGFYQSAKQSPSTN
jgi:hypothetical protein